jgi:hypothetical protein
VATFDVWPSSLNRFEAVAADPSLTPLAGHLLDVAVAELPDGLPRALAGEPAVPSLDRREDRLVLPLLERVAGLGRQVRTAITCSCSRICASRSISRALREVAVIAAERGLLVIADEIYERLVYGERG